MAGTGQLRSNLAGENFGLLSLNVAAASSGDHAVTFTGHLVAGGMVYRQVTVNGDSGPEFAPVSFDANTFGSLSSLSWSGDGEVLIDDISISEERIDRNNPTTTIPQHTLVANGGNIITINTTNAT
ncbi:MAG: hypothetical protein ACK56F_27090, partial [bacterium]